jgi:hypothetical protein
MKTTQIVIKIARKMIAPQEINTLAKGEFILHLA